MTKCKRYVVYYCEVDTTDRSNFAQCPHFKQWVGDESGWVYCEYLSDGRCSCPEAQAEAEKENPVVLDYRWTP